MESGRNGTNLDFPEQPSIASLFPPDKSDTDASSEYNQIPPNFPHHNSNSIEPIFPPARSQTDEIIIPNPTITSTSFSHVFPSSIGPPTIQISIPSLFPPTVSETEIDGSASSESNEARPRVFDSIASCFPPVRSPSNGSEIYETTLDHSIASIFPAEAGFNSYVFQQFLRSLSLQNYRPQVDPSRDNPLRKLADAIDRLSSSVSSENPHLKISDVVQFGRLSTPSIFFLGIAFRFADLELQSKVNNLEEASKTYDTDKVQALLEGETENGSAKNTGSHCRNLVRLKRVIDLVRVMLEQVLASGGNSLVEPFTAAYEQVFAPYHGWTLKKAVIAALEELPSKDILLTLLNEDGDSVKEPMQKYITASKAFLRYVDNIFLSTETGAELLKMI